MTGMQGSHRQGVGRPREGRPNWRRSVVGLALSAALLAGGDVRAADGVDAVLGVGVTVSDVEASARFYREALGLKEARRLPLGGGPAGVVALSSTGKMDAPLVVLKRAEGPLEPGRAGFGRIITGSSDARAVLARIRAAGYAVTRVVEGPNGAGSMEVWTRDPDGYEVEVFQPPSGK
jgi:lactoylglutathione lyase